MEDIVNLLLDKSDQVDTDHDWHLKSLLVAMGNDSKHEVMIKMKQSLIEEKSRI